ncbi:MAG: T9SS type A sorting domain-containing protein [Bacteroidetes bacterium]|nr:T9SS type A sorting domain-containing protein [Bacteroidota bacterium]
MLNLSLSEEPVNGVFRLKDVTGREVLKVKLAQKPKQAFSIENLSPGVYFYTVSSAKTDDVNGKVILVK